MSRRHQVAINEPSSTNAMVDHLVRCMGTPTGTGAEVIAQTLYGYHPLRALGCPWEVIGPQGERRKLQCPNIQPPLRLVCSPLEGEQRIDGHLRACHSSGGAALRDLHRPGRGVARREADLHVP